MKTATAHARPVRLTSLLVALLMVASLAVVQAAPAMANAPGWARLVAGVNVLPGTAQYAVQVETQATAVDTIVVAVPSGIGISATDAVSVRGTGSEGADLGFTGTVQTVGAFQRVIFTGGEVPANANAVVRFSADIDPPASASERSGSFKVSLSGDGGNSFATADTGQRDPRRGGTLTTTIKFLEVLQVDITGPTGVVDDEDPEAPGVQLGGTEGQAISVRTTIKNHATIPVTVTADLAASSPNGFSADEQISDPVSDLTVLGGATATADFDVTLGSAVNEDGDAVDRPVTFSGSVVENLTGATGLGASSEELAVQVLGTIAFDGANFGPTIVSPGVETFSVPAVHSGTPSFQVALGSGTVAFSNTTATNQQAYSFAPGADPASQLLEFTGQVQGDDGDHPVSITYFATDDNGHSYIETLALTEPGLFGPVPVEVTIDAIAPEITAVINLPDDADGREQAAAKDGDTITVTGVIDDTGADITQVRLVANGQIIATTDSVSRSLDGGSYSTSFSGEEVSFPGGLGQFLAVAVAIDDAENVGVGFSGAVDFDNLVPRLDSARVESTIDLDQGVLGQLRAEASVISVRFEENALVRGGCNPNQYTVDGQNVVREVRYSDNTPCFSGQAGPDNDRLLILSVPIDREANPLVRYSPIPGDRIADFAGNLAPEDTVTAVSNIVPAAPDLLDVYRNTGNRTPEECQADEDACEDAYQEGSGDSAVHWTRSFDRNDDTIVCVAGARTGYSVEVTDGNGNAIVGSRQATTDTTPCIRVQIGSTDTTYVRGIRFVNQAGAGEELLVNIALDTVLPAVTDVARDGDEVTVSFNDVLVEGNNSSLNWLLYERLADGSEVAGPPNSVTTPGDAFSTDRSKRVLTGDIGENGDFIGVGYVFFSGTRYGDRGGNKLADLPGPVN